MRLFDDHFVLLAPQILDDNSLSCTFDQDDFCGYYDDSPGLVHWTRSRDTPGSPGIPVLT